MSNSKSKLPMGLALVQVRVRELDPASAQPAGRPSIDTVTEQPPISSEVVLVATAGYEAPAPKLAKSGECTVKRPSSNLATVWPPGSAEIPEPPGPMATGGSSATPAQVLEIV